MAAAPSRGPTYKVVLLGELGVGKTSMFRRLKDNSFDEYQTATTGIDSCSKIVKVDGNTVMVNSLLSSYAQCMHVASYHMYCVHVHVHNLCTCMNIQPHPLSVQAYRIPDCIKAGSQYDAMCAMQGVNVPVYGIRLGFYSCVSCVHALGRTMNRASCTTRVMLSVQSCYTFEQLVNH